MGFPPRVIDDDRLIGLKVIKARTCIHCTSNVRQVSTGYNTDGDQNPHGDLDTRGIHCGIRDELEPI